MLKDKISGFVEKVRSVDGILACALISRDGIVAGKYFDIRDSVTGYLIPDQTGVAQAEDNPPPSSNSELR